MPLRIAANGHAIGIQFESLNLDLVEVLLNLVVDWIDDRRRHARTLHLGPYIDNCIEFNVKIYHTIGTLGTGTSARGVRYLRLYNADCEVESY